MESLISVLLAAAIIPPSFVQAQPLVIDPAGYALSPVPAANWSSFYGGFHGGAAGGTLTLEPGNTEIDGAGLLAGVQLGFRQQFDMITLGVQTDLSSSSAVTDTSLSGVRGTLEAYGSTTLRAGVAPADPFLVYALGGIAYGHGTGSYNGERASNWHTGWTVGAGIEMAVNEDVNLFAEYAYAALGPRTYTFSGPVSADAGYDLHILRTGFNFKF
jgi:opacity protein-like surface antigen